MILGTVVAQALRDRGIARAAGVPCGHLRSLIAALTVQGRYVPAANEGAALAIAAGAQLVGVRSAVLAQNSGLGNLINPLASVLMPGRIPVLVVMSLRGWPDPLADEPQHAIMGATTQALLDTVQVGHGILSRRDANANDLSEMLDRAEAAHRAGLPWFLLVEPGAISAKSLSNESAGSVARGGEDNLPPAWDRPAAVAAISRHLGDALVFATAGYVSRQLFAICDRPRNFYVQGGMGHALALGIGAALESGRRVLVLDGDGAVLMHLGTAATAAAVAGVNLVHVVLDNGAYESTGAQPTTSPKLCWSDLARGLGYCSCAIVSSATELEAAMQALSTANGLHMIVAKISLSPHKAPPRASSALPLIEVTKRFAAAALEDRSGDDC